jgi:C4-dicarboxylate-specific signal transduction histidine kinase
LTISAEANNNSTVTVRFRDTGAGVRNPESLFRPFHKATDANGLGLYVSRAIIRSFRGELVHEPAEDGCCFAVMLNADDAHDSRAD